METENLIQLILLFALVIGSAIAGFVSPRRKAAAGKQPQSAPKPLPTPAPGPRKAPRPAKPTPETPFASEYATLAEVQAAEQTAARHPAQRQEPQPVETDENQAILADFDLRKAVIYSELLKPKFDEENGR